jgi:hypothetical protein
MDPEETMIAEGRQRAAASGVDNLSFIVGGSDDLAALSPDLGKFAAVTIAQAFHWIADHDAVLRALDDLLDRENGAVALVGYVKEPDYNLIWLNRAPWNAVEAILRHHLTGVPEGPSPAGRHDPFPEILARSAFSRIELLTRIRRCGSSLDRCRDRFPVLPRQSPHPPRRAAHGVRGGRPSHTRRRRHRTGHRPVSRQRPHRPQALNSLSLRGTCAHACPVEAASRQTASEARWISPASVGWNPQASK